MAPKDLALRRSDQRWAPISAYRRPFPNCKNSVPFNRWSSKLVGALPEMVQTIMPKDFTQYCSSPPLCTMIIDILWIYSFSKTYLLPFDLSSATSMLLFSNYCFYHFTFNWARSARGCRTRIRGLRAIWKLVIHCTALVTSQVSYKYNTSTCCSCWYMVPSKSNQNMRQFGVAHEI